MNICAKVINVLSIQIFKNSFPFCSVCQKNTTNRIFIISIVILDRLVKPPRLENEWSGRNYRYDFIFLYIILQITKLMGGVPFDNVTVSSFYDRVKYHESIDTKSNHNLVLRFSWVLRQFNLCGIQLFRYDLNNILYIYLE